MLASQVKGNGRGGKIRFAATGADQTFVVPGGVTVLYAKLWGAGGGAGSGNQNVGRWTGGGGAYIHVSIPVTPGETLIFKVGMGGRSGNSTIPELGGYPDGGNAGRGSDANWHGSGGGSSSIWRGATCLAAAGAGGGAGVVGDGPCTYGGAGGVTAGQKGGAPRDYDYNWGDSGKGATQTAGGARNASCYQLYAYGVAGAKNQGGNGGGYPGTSLGYNGGAGGGGGWYGGGGSGAVYGGTGGAGGGSSSTLGTMIDSEAGFYAFPGGMWDEDYRDCYGHGGLQSKHATYAHGRDGGIVIALSPFPKVRGQSFFYGPGERWKTARSTAHEQSFTVPELAPGSTLEAILLGAGGGGGIGANGGAGALVSVNLAVSAGQVLTIVPGSGGSANRTWATQSYSAVGRQYSQQGQGGWPGGAHGGTNGAYGGGGGGFSAIKLGTAYLAIAAGGGGGGSELRGSTLSSPVAARGAGDTGARSVTNGGVTYTTLTGESASALGGGAGGYTDETAATSNYPGVAGGQYTGGYALNSGGGGGSGYYGGGSGARVLDVNNYPFSGGGGGGLSWFDAGSPLISDWLITSAAGQTHGGLRSPTNWLHVFPVTGPGWGGWGEAPGGDGMVMLRWRIP